MSQQARAVGARAAGEPRAAGAAAGEASADAGEAERRERLRALVSPGEVAVLTMELQRGVVGSEALFPALVDQTASDGIAAVAARICEAARSVGVHVVHCTVETRDDGAGGAVNCRLLAAADRLRRERGVTPIAVGSVGARLVPELGDDPRDITVARLHGLTPFTSTSLDQILRNLSVSTLVVTGVSVNVGVLGLCLSAVDLGYQIVLVRDAVTGVPADYAEAVIANTLSLLTTVVDSGELLRAWL